MAIRARGGGDFGFDSGLTLLVLDRVAIARLFLPGGEAYQWGRNLGIEVAELAKTKLFPFHGYVTGDLQRSVASSVVPVGMGVQVNVRATARHAVYYILGTRPHRIEPSAPRRWLRWTDMGSSVYQAGGGFFTYAAGVNHPGFSGRNFLDDAKSEVLLSRGISRA